MTSLSQLATVTVTYQPDLAVLEHQLRALPEQSLKLLVDNASGESARVGLLALAATLPRTRCLFHERNLGLAAALNSGVQEVSKEVDITHVLLLDQDSEPAGDACPVLLHAFDTLERAGHHVGSVGPRLLDPDTGLEHGFHQATRWRWRRHHPAPGSRQPVPCINLNGSGTLARLDTFLRLDGLDEALFIDHVDTEWAFRVLAAGMKLWGIPDATFVHRMGASSRRIWLLGWRLWPMRSPQRHYFLFRNAVSLMRRDYVPVIWKTWAVIKLAMTLAVTLCIGPERKLQSVRMLAGIRDGLVMRGRLGPRHDG